MMKRNIEIGRDLIGNLSGAVSFFFQHLSLDYDGANRTATVTYHGSNGLKLSVDTSFNPVIEAGDVKKIENGNRTGEHGNENEAVHE